MANRAGSRVESSAIRHPDQPDGIDVAILDHDIRQTSRAVQRAAEKATEALKALDEIADRGTEFYALEVLREYAKLRDTIAYETMALAVWANERTSLSTHKLGQAAGISNSTVARWTKSQP